MSIRHGIVGSIGLVLALAACGHSQEDGSATAKPSAAAAAAVTAEAPPAKCDHCDGVDTVPDSVKVESIALGASPARGPENAPVTVVVFSDFECSFCAKGEATMRELEAAYPGKVRFVFKNAPLPMHPHARLAAKAALAANEQGKFWAYHDALFAQQDALDRAGLERAAQQVGLDLPRFRTALDGPQLDAVIDADLAEARRVEVKGTPAFFVNGRNLQGAQPLAAFRAKVDQALAAR
jgi:protein-disulfide isomerase